MKKEPSRMEKNGKRPDGDFHFDLRGKLQGWNNLPNHNPRFTFKKHPLRRVFLSPYWRDRGCKFFM